MMHICKRVSRAVASNSFVSFGLACCPASVNSAVAVVCHSVVELISDTLVNQIFVWRIVYRDIQCSVQYRLVSVSTWSRTFTVLCQVPDVYEPAWLQRTCRSVRL